MSFFQRSKRGLVPTSETIELAPVAEGVTTESLVAAQAAARQDDAAAAAPVGKNSRRSEWSPAAKWFFNDIFYIAMLLLALAGVMLSLPVDYWIIITPIFGLITIVEGWNHFKTRSEKLGLAFRIAAIWCAVLLSIYLFENVSVKGVMTVNATSLAIIMLLALGTFVAGVQAHVWQICAVGGVLFLAVPGVGWLDNSPLLLAGATVLVIVCGGIVWWIEDSRATIASD